MQLKQILSTALLTFSVFSMASETVLLTIDNKPVYLSEFEYIYNKNNDANVVEQKTEAEYLDLFINFKLKVAEAKAHGLDTTQAFINELSGYRKQLAAPYMVSDEAKEALLQEAYQRKKADLELSHILIQLPQNATASDTLAAYNKALLVKERIEATEAQGAFESIAREMSSDPSVQDNGGYLGWISVFRTVYSFETGAYNTPVGEISNPVRSQFGYHIIKVHNKRAAQGEVLVSHIMTFTQEGDDAVNQSAKEEIDSLYERVLAGEDFAKLAQENSQDRGSASNGGALPWFGTGYMVPMFEKAAFALENKGDVSAPIQSMYGWHIIKLQDRKPLGSFDDVKAELQQMIDRDSRNAQVAESFVQKLKADYGYKTNLKMLNALYAIASECKLGDAEFEDKTVRLEGVLFSFATKQYTVSDFVKYVRDNAATSKTIPQEIIDEKVNAYVQQELLSYEDSQLEYKYPDFRNLMSEYHDGILLFEISNQKVWERSTKDVEGITEFFKKNKKKYAWDEPRYKGHVVYCKDEATYEASKKIIKKLDVDSIESCLYKRMNDSIQYVKIERGLFVEGDNAAIDKYVYKIGSFEPSEEYPYVFVVGKKLRKYPESYTDVRGSVTSDYQNFLEEEWVADMRKRYQVKVNDEALKD